jgi:ABC-type phosphate/phosphonate transport system substrate-binding protein
MKYKGWRKPIKVFVSCLTNNINKLFVIPAGLKPESRGNCRSFLDPGYNHAGVTYKWNLRDTILVYVFLISVCLLAGPVFSYFEDTITGVRPAGMGGAFVSIADDTNAPLFNPAGLARLTRIEFNGTYADLYSNLNTRVFSGQDTYYGQHLVAAAIPLDQTIGSFGLTWSGFHSVFYKENTVALSYARRIWQPYQLDVGINVKALQWRVEPNQYSTDSTYFPYSERGKTVITADLGILATPLENWQVGISGENLIPADVGLTTTEYIPQLFRIGTSYLFEMGNEYVQSLQPIVEATYRNEEYNLKLGLEAMFFKDIIAIRTGINQDCFSAGAGLNYQLPEMPLYMKLSYAYSLPFQIMDSMGSHRVGLSFEVNPIVRKKEVPVTPIPTPQVDPAVAAEKKRQEEEALRTLIGEEIEKKNEEQRVKEQALALEAAKAKERARQERAKTFPVNMTDTIVIGFERKVLSDYTYLQEALEHAEYLESFILAKTGLKVVRQEYGSSEELIASFQQGEIDVGLGPSFIFEALNSSKDAAPEFTFQIKGKSSQQLCLWILEDAAIQTVEDLEGKRLGYVNFEHTKYLKKYIFQAVSGYKETNYFSDKQHCNSPVTALVALQMGEVDAIVGLEYMEGVLARVEKRMHNKIVRLATGAGPEIINAPGFVRTYLKESKQSKVDQLLQALFSAHQDAEAKKFFEYFGVEKIVPIK